MLVTTEHPRDVPQVKLVKDSLKFHSFFSKSGCPQDAWRRPRDFLFFCCFFFASSSPFSTCPSWYYSPLWKRVIAGIESSRLSDCGKVWGDVGYYHRIQRPPKQSHNRLGSYSRPKAITHFQSGLFCMNAYQTQWMSKVFLLVGHH